MLKFEYGDVYTRFTGEAEELQAVRQNLIVKETKKTPETYLFEGDEFLSGLLPSLCRKLSSSKTPIKYEIIGQESPPDPDTLSVDPKILRGIELYEDQQSIVWKALYNRRGLICSPTASGKTIISASIAKILEVEQGLSTLMVVPGQASMDQAAERWNEYGLAPVGRLGDSHRELDKFHLVAVVNSLYEGLKRKDKRLLKWLDEVGVLLLMETHHVPSRMWSAVGYSISVPYRIGLSATPFSTQQGPTTPDDYRLLGITGDIFAYVDDATLMNRGRTATPHVHFLSAGSEWLGGETNWHEVKKVGINENTSRNGMISELASQLALSGRKVLVLVNEVGHGKQLARSISKRMGKALLYKGQSQLLSYAGGIEQHTQHVSITELVKMLKEIEFYTVIGSPAIKEDADLPECNVLIMAGGGKSFRGIIQKAGRVLRPKSGLNTVDIIDFDDRDSFVLRAQSRARRKLYSEKYAGAKGFTIQDYTSVTGVLKAVLSET